MMVDPAAVCASPPDVGQQAGAIEEMAEQIRAARTRGASVICCFGAHAIRNGLAPVLLELARGGWITHLATNGGGSIHDWELAFIGRTGEPVRPNLADGTFGLWEETGYLMGMAIALGGLDDLGHGASIGRVIVEGALEVPDVDDLRAMMTGPPARAAAAADVLELIERLGLAPGRHEHPHARPDLSLQAGLWSQGMPLTVHPGIGYDIIHPHPATSGGAHGRAAHRDFLAFAEAVRGLSGGVYLSVGSAIMSPMICEKALAMAQNVALQDGAGIRDHLIGVVDIAESGWDWSTGEPPDDRPEYYMRYCKSFSRMGGTLRYLCLDNRAFLGRLLYELTR